MDIKSFCQLFGPLLSYIDFFVLQKAEVGRVDTGKQGKFR
jgi:hypothetical protein